MATHDDDLITALMLKFARREKLTDEEMRILDEWCQESPENQKMVDEFGDLEWVRSELAKLKQAPMEEIWEGINQYLDEIGAPDDRGKAKTLKEIAEHPSRRMWGWKRLTPMAAAVIVCVACFWMIYYKHRATEKENAGLKIVRSTGNHDLVAGDDEVVLKGDNDSNVEIDDKPKGTTVRYATGNYAEKTGSNQLALYGWDPPSDIEKGMKSWSDGPGRQSDTVWKGISVGKNCAPYLMRLPDGSNVWLAGGTRLWYPVGIGKDPATYIVDGKAFFDVKHDVSRVFTVRTLDGGSVEVLGTSFLVETNKEKGAVVALLNGSVKVHSGTGVATLKPSQEAAFGSGRVDVLPFRDSAAAMAWVEPSRYFHFNNTKFTDAVDAVAALYGYRVENPKDLQGIPITVNVRKDQTPEGVVSTIGQIEHGVLFVWVKDRVIHISNKPPPRQ